MTAPYYADDLVTLYHGDAFELLPHLAEKSVDLVLTDPPFDDRTHTMARTNHTAAPRGMRGLSGGKSAFAAFTPEVHHALFEDLGRITRRWVISSLPTSTAFRFEVDPPPGLRCLRIAVWVKTNPMPSLTGDRPAMGWEPIACLHRADTKPSWAGGGKAMNYVGPTSQGSGHPTQKPLGMIRDLIRLFSAPGDTVLDPFAGSGTTLRAAADEGRKAIGYEMDERYCELAAKRLSQQAFDLWGEEDAS